LFVSLTLPATPKPAAWHSSCSLRTVELALHDAAPTLHDGLSWGDGIDVRQKTTPTHAACADITGDGNDELLARMVYHGPHPTASWIVFTRRTHRWQPLRFRDPLLPRPYVVRENFGVGSRTDPHTYDFVPSGLRLRLSNGAVRETVRTYHSHDSQFKPRGPWVTRTWRWNGSRLVQTAGPLLSPYT
jgi:hypothetical protein